MPKKLLIIGGVAGGATAAARARRIDEQAQIILFERGDYVSFANCGLPYFIGEVIKKRDNLLIATPKFLMDRFNIEVRTGADIIEIDRNNKRIKVWEVQKGIEYFQTYDKLILAPGAEPVKPPLEGINLETLFTLRTLPDTDRIKEYVDENNPAAALIVGGGFIGLEMAENLKLRGVDVTIIEMQDQVMAPIDYEMAAIVHNHLREKGVKLRLKESVKSFRKEGGRTVVSTSAGEIVCDMVILAIGVKPENKLAKEGGLKIGARGGIITDEYMLTSDPDIYAVGDAVEVKDLISGDPVQIPLAGPANKQARIAADNALGRETRYRGTQGTFVVKVFDLTVAATGNSEKILKGRNKPYTISYTHSGSQAGYYPDAEVMAVKLLFAPDDGELLGAQIIGKKGVDKRIDVVATAIRGSMTVFDLEEFEHGYSPPYASAKDAINMAGFVAANMLKGDLECVFWHELDNLDPKKYQFLDVRGKMEIIQTRLLGNAINIPLHELRSKLPELDKEKIYVPYCAIGLRGYVAHRILVQNGFKSKNLSGGMRTIGAVLTDRGV